MKTAIRQLLTQPRWCRHAGFIRKWALPPPRGATGKQLDELERDLGQPLPPALREAYLLFGRYWTRSEVCGEWRFVEAQDGLKVAKFVGCPPGFVPLLTEAHGLGACAARTADFARQDPPIYATPERVLAESVSEFVLGLLFQHRLEPPEDWNATAAAGVFYARLTSPGLCQVLESAYTRVPVAAWHPLLFHADVPVRFVGDADTLARLDGTDWVHLVTRGRGAQRVALVAAEAQPGSEDDYLSAMNRLESGSSDRVT